MTDSQLEDMPAYQLRSCDSHSSEVAIVAASGRKIISVVRVHLG